MKTKAAILYNIDKPLQIREITIPKLDTGQVLVKILYSGICHSQLNEIKGFKGKDKYLPHTLGHEGSGIVKGVGSGVTKVERNDYVVLHWLKGSGIDAKSTKYLLDDKIINSGPITTFSEYAIISENRMTKISKDIPPSVASLFGCAVLTGAGMIKNNLKITPDDSIAIFGIGGLGFSSLLYSHTIDCSTIIAVDIYDNKLKIAKKYGATHTINSRYEDTISIIKKITNDIGVDYAIETSGIKSVIELAFDSLHSDGTLMFAGNIRKGEKINLNPMDLINGKKMFGTFGGNGNPDMDIPYYSDLYLKGNFNLESLLTNYYTIDEINQAFNDLDSGKIIGRGLIKFKNDRNKFTKKLSSV